MTLGFVQPNDTTSIYELLQESDLPVSDLTPEHLQHFLVMKEGGAVLGVAGVERLGLHRVLIRSLAVSPAHRGKRIASQLYAAIENHACSIGLREVYALTTTIEEWLMRLDFERVERSDVPDDVRSTAEFTGLCPASAVVLRKVLRVPAENAPNLYVCS